jgi:hypothetical protein
MRGWRQKPNNREELASVLKKSKISQRISEERFPEIQLIVQIPFVRLKQLYCGVPSK